MTIRVRALSPEEVGPLTELAHSRKRGAGLVRRAQIIMHAVEERLSAPEIAARMGLCGETVRFGIKRFNARGLQGLAEDMRSGRPPTYSAEERSRVIRTALTRPAELGLPFACWTLNRLVAHLSEQGIGVRRSRISEILLAEGLQWRREETWFGARVDPAFARKRGRSSNSTRRRRRAASWSAWMRWGRRRARAIRVSVWCGPARENGPPRRSTMAGGVSPAMYSALLSLSKGQPATGAALTAPYEGRTTANWIDFLCRVEGWIDPAAERIYAVVDNLNTHSALDVLLFNLAHPRWEFVFQPKYAAYLNLIEPWWKVLRSLALPFGKLRRAPARRLGGDRTSGRARH
jgi:transposase